MNKIDRLKHQNESIGPNVVQLLSNLDDHIQDQTFRTDLKHSLKHLTDLTFALDESSIVAVTDHKGKIQYVNNKFCQISKYSKEELIGKDHRIINSGFHGKEFMRKLWETISSGQVWNGEIKNRAKDGTYYWVNTTIVPFLDDEGNPYQYLAIRSEVTKLKEVQDELKNMMTRVIGIQEEERKRFSRELHDGVGQSMFSLLIQLDQLINDTSDSRLEKLREDVSFVIEDIRGLAWELRPSVLDDLGVVPAIRKYIENFSQHYGIQVQLECSLRTRLNIQKETTIYRIIQEALTNIGKYANVDEARVSIDETESVVEVLINDKGEGFIRDPKGKGVGLFSMEERARGLGGQFSISSKIGEGTTISFSVPK
ncbi:PAS domain S-box protein [Cytobacillus sp. S13-E01]|uniref:sensor histidine kinase n=1 Tax=Cytobacillus sp. S13-E01 TaxID=3031326 RepID=UPI0023D85F75|nr:PAS domain-containing protein [Cytobacillus sp. S13-E01]MDF0725836.1 PAS domain S-box protein [Cytobacillus sp. S13-E01]